MKHLKLYEEFDFNDDDFDFEEDDPNVEIHNGIRITEDDDVEYHKFKMVDNNIESGDLVVHIEDKYWKGEFGPVISRVYQEYGDMVSFCLEEYEDLESDWQTPKSDLSKIKIIK